MAGPLLLELRHYETIASIVEFGTVTRAAQHLSTTQSALSHRLAQAERRLGVVLFSRGADRRLVPTQDGLAVAQAALRALGELRRVEEALLGGDSQVETTVRLAVGSYDAFAFFPGFRRRVAEVRPDVELDLVIVGDAPGSALARRDVDLVLAPGRPTGDHQLVPIFDDELILVCAPSHHLAQRASVEAEDLVAETYLTYNAQPTPGFEYDRFVRPSGTAPRIVRVVRQTSAIIELVAAGAGVSILSRWATAAAVDAGRLMAVRCGDGLDIEWHAALRHSDPGALAVSELLAAHLAAGSATEA